MYRPSQATRAILSSPIQRILHSTDSALLRSRNSRSNTDTTHTQLRREVISVDWIMEEKGVSYEIAEVCETRASEWPDSEKGGISLVAITPPTYTEQSGSDHKIEL